MSFNIERNKYGYTKYLIKQIKDGDKMKTEIEMKFIEKSAIPVLIKGKQQINLKPYLEKIPEKQAWIIPAKNELANLNTIKDAVKRYNKEAKKQIFNATQRTENSKLYLYVYRV